MAGNIKDRQNRQCVERCLKMLIEKIKLQKNVGLCCVAGIDTNDNEFVHVKECNTDKFIYNCGSKFDIELLYSFFPKTTANGNIIMVTGDFTWVYDATFSDSKSSVDNKHKSDNIKFTLKDKVVGLLNKRQSRGGMSQNRIARLAEDSRLHYGTRIVDSINKYCTGSPVYMIGSVELCKKVIENKTLQKTITTIDKWYSWEDSYKFLINNKKELLEMFLKPSEKDEEKVKDVLELVKKDPDMLLFGKDIKEYDYAIAIDGCSADGDIVVKKDSKMYAELAPYKRIAKKYFKVSE